MATATAERPKSKDAAKGKAGEKAAKERDKAAKAEEKARAAKDREKAAKAKEKERLAKQKEKEKAAKAKEKERLAKQKEKEKAAKAKEKEKAAKAEEKDRRAAQEQAGKASKAGGGRAKAAGSGAGTGPRSRSGSTRPARGGSPRPTVHEAGWIAEELGRASAVSRSTKRPTLAASFTTRDHDVIRRWAESRGGVPADVRGTGDGEGSSSAGVLRIEFRDEADRLEDVSWDAFFATFDESDVDFLYQEYTKDGGESRFHKIVRA